MKITQILLILLLVISIMPVSLATPPIAPCRECNENGYAYCINKFQSLNAYNSPECQSVISRCYNACQKRDQYSCGFNCDDKYRSCIELKPESAYIKYGEEKNVGRLKIKLEDIQEKTCPPNADCAYVATVQGAFKINGRQSIDMILNKDSKFEVDGKFYLLQFNGLYEIANDRIGIIGEPTPTEPPTRLDRKSSLSASVLVYNLGSKSEREERSKCFEGFMSCVEGCPEKKQPKACTEDAKVCLDGSSVGRDPYNNCEWQLCPSENQCGACKREHDECMTQEMVGIEKICEPNYKECLKGCQTPSVEPKCDNGCFSASSGRCVSVGFRLKENDASMYCDIDGMLKEQKSDGSQASNSYECLGNFQSDGRCVSVSENLDILQRIIKWFSKIFGGA